VRCQSDKITATLFLGSLLSRSLHYYWPAKWASIVLLAGICRRLSSVTLPAGRPPNAWAVGRPTLYGGPVRLRPVYGHTLLT